jgi:hypothetical protein
MKKKKTILIEVENKQLDALEDLLTADLSAIEKEKAKKLSIKLWRNLVSAYDNENNALESESTISPLALYNALEVVMKHDESFYTPKAKELKVQNIDEFNEKIKLIPENIIAIISHPDFQGERRKAIYVKDETKKGLKINTYFFNSGEYNFTTLREYLDPLNHYLLNVSKKAIINVGCYELSKNNLLKCNIDELKAQPIKEIKSSIEKPFNTKSDFQIIKNGIKKRHYLQKFMIGYKNDFNL